MMYLVFDIPEGTSVKEFLGDISCHNHIKPEVIATLIQESLVSDDYYIRTYPVDGREGKVSLKELTLQDIVSLLFYQRPIGEQGCDLIESESMIFKHKS